MEKVRETLQPLVGEWSVAMMPSDAPWPEVVPDSGARTTWSWLGSSDLLVQRWSIPIDEAPDGFAVIGWDPGRSTFLQHYFDDRGVVRVYEVALADGVLTLERTAPDFSPLHFSQRFLGRLSPDGARIDGAWHIAHDHQTWQKDFDLVYTRLDVT